MKSWCRALLFCSLTWMKCTRYFSPYHTTQQIVLSCTCGLKQDGCCRQSCEHLLPSSHWPISHTEYLNLEITDSCIENQKCFWYQSQYLNQECDTLWFPRDLLFRVCCLQTWSRRKKITSLQWQSYYLTKRYLYKNVPVWLIQVLIELKIPSQCTVPLS